VVENAQKSRRETAMCRLVFVKRLDAKLSISRVILDLVEWFLFLFDVIDLFDGGERIVPDLRYKKILKLTDSADPR
jgi:hypothetical protein